MPLISAPRGVTYFYYFVVAELKNIVLNFEHLKKVYMD